MTDNTNLEDQDVELNENEVEEAHDPQHADAQAVASVDAADDKGPRAKKRKGDKGGQDPMGKVVPGTPDKHSARVVNKGAEPFKAEGVRLTRAGMINSAYQKMNSMAKEDLEKLYNKVIEEDSTDESVQSVSNETLDYQADWSEDLNALVESEATLSDEFKDKAETIFNAAISTKLSEEINRLEEKYGEELASEIEETKAGLVDKVDSYLNYVVESWMEENKLAVQSGLRTEIAEKFMNNLKDLFTESYIEVPESKVDLVDNLASEVEELENTLNDQTGKSIAMQEELEGYKRESIIREASRDLAETQIEKLTSLTDNIDFESEENFAEKVKTVKESYFKKGTKSVAGIEEIDEEADQTVETSGAMSHYVSALKSQIKN